MLAACNSGHNASDTATNLTQDQSIISNQHANGLGTVQDQGKSDKNLDASSAEVNAQYALYQSIKNGNINYRKPGMLNNSARKLLSAQTTTKVFNYNESDTGVYDIILDGATGWNSFQVGGATFTMEQMTGKLTSRGGKQSWDSYTGNELLGGNLGVKCYAVISESNIIDPYHLDSTRSKQEITNTIRLVGLNNCGGDLSAPITKSNEVITTDNLAAYGGTSKLVFQDDGNLVVYGNNANANTIIGAGSSNKNFAFHMGAGFINSVNMDDNYQKRLISTMLATAIENDQGSDGYSTIFKCDAKALHTSNGNYLNLYRQFSGCEIDDNGNIKGGYMPLANAKKLASFYTKLAQADDNHGIRYTATINDTMEAYNNVSGVQLTNTHTTINEAKLATSGDWTNATSYVAGIPGVSTTIQKSTTHSYSYTKNFAQSNTITTGIAIKGAAGWLISAMAGTEWTSTFQFATMFGGGYSEMDGDSNTDTLTETLASPSYQVQPGMSVHWEQVLFSTNHSGLVRMPIPLTKDKNGYVWLSTTYEDKIHGLMPLEINKINLWKMNNILKEAHMNFEFAPFGEAGTKDSTPVAYRYAQYSAKDGNHVVGFIQDCDKSGVCSEVKPTK